MITEKEEEIEETSKELEEAIRQQEEQYEAMKQAPSVRELMDHIDRHVRITRMISLPISAAEAASDPAVARAYTESGFADCVELLNRNK